MEIRNRNPLGKNNFDKLASAGLVEGANAVTDEQRQTKLEAKIVALKALDSKFEKLQSALAGLYVMKKPKQLELLTSAIKACKGLLDKPLPQGTKARVTSMVSELISLREGVFTGAATDKKTLAVIGCVQAKDEFKELIEATNAQIQKIKIEADELNDFYRQAEEAIKDFAHESDTVALGNKPFIVARVSVVPANLATADGALLVSRISRVGFRVQNLAGYPVLKDQIVLGLSPKLLNPNMADFKSAKSKELLKAEADRIRKILSKAKGEKLQYVSSVACPYKGGVYYWLMTEKELNQFAKALPGGAVKITRWGFAFN